MFKTAYLEIMRPANCLMASFAALVGLFVADLQPELYSGLLVFFVVFLVTGAGNAINDYYDRDIDKVNRPDRPIPSGRMAPRQAFLWSLSLFFVGCSLSAFLNPLSLAVALLNSAALYLYARNLKGTPLAGNLCVAYLTGSTFLFGGLASGDLGATKFLTLLAFLVTVSREIEKDIEDLEGDRAGGALTLPMVVGERPSVALALVSSLAAVILSYQLPLGRAYLVVVTVANLLFCFSAWKMVRGDASGAQRILKGGMALALVAFLAGAVFQ